MGLVGEQGSSGGMRQTHTQETPSRKPTHLLDDRTRVWEREYEDQRMLRKTTDRLGLDFAPFFPVHCWKCKGVGGGTLAT